MDNKTGLKKGDYIENYKETKENEVFIFMYINGVEYKGLLNAEEY